MQAAVVPTAKLAQLGVAVVVQCKRSASKASQTDRHAEVSECGWTRPDGVFGLSRKRRGAGKVLGGMRPWAVAHFVTAQTDGSLSSFPLRV